MNFSRQYTHFFCWVYSISEVTSTRELMRNCNDAHAPRWHFVRDDRAAKTYERQCNRFLFFAWHIDFTLSFYMYLSQYMLYTHGLLYNNPYCKNMPRCKQVILSGCIGIKKFIFGVAMADSDANATPNMNFFHLKSVSLPGICRLGFTQTM